MNLKKIDFIEIKLNLKNILYLKLEFIKNKKKKNKNNFIKIKIILKY